jgi:hypothetical protein
MKRIQVIGVLFVLAVMSTVCFADSIPSEQLKTGPGDLGGVAGLQFTVNVATTGSNGFTMDLNVLNITGTGGLQAATANLLDFSINLLGGGNTPITTSKFTGPTGWTEVDGGIAGVGNQPPGCSGGGGAASWLCAYATGSPLTLGAGQSFDFIFTGTYSGTITSPFDLKASGDIGGTKLAVSSSGFQVPEPSAVLFLGSGLSGLALLRRLKNLK